MTSIDLACLALVIALVVLAFTVARLRMWHRRADYWFERFCERRTHDDASYPIARVRSYVSVYSEGPTSFVDVDALPVTGDDAMSESRADRITENRCVVCGGENAEGTCAAGCGAPMCSRCLATVWDSVCAECYPSKPDDDYEDLRPVPEATP